MIKLRSIFPKVLIAMLVTLSMALFVVPATRNQVQAQSKFAGDIVDLCIDRSNGELKKPTNGQCPGKFPSEPKFDFIAGVELGDGGVCKVRNQTTSQWGLVTPGGEIIVNQNGRCVFADEPSREAGVFMRYANIPQYTPPGSGNTNTNTNTPTNTGTGNNTGTNTGSGNSGGIPQVQGDCETGFHKVGPLCVPNSPFTNKDALVNSADAPGLAVRIIRILLYFAGIVAVIMAIIGGYRIMTAQGNEAQATSGRKTLTNAIIGLIIVILSYIIIQAVVNFLTK